MFFQGIAGNNNLGKFYHHLYTAFPHHFLQLILPSSEHWPVTLGEQNFLTLSLANAFFVYITSSKLQSIHSDPIVGSTNKRVYLLFYESQNDNSHNFYFRWMWKFVDYSLYVVPTQASILRYKPISKQSFEYANCSFKNGTSNSHYNSMFHTLLLQNPHTLTSQRRSYHEMYFNFQSSKVILYYMFIFFLFIILLFKNATTFTA